MVAQVSQMVPLDRTSEIAAPGLGEFLERFARKDSALPRAPDFYDNAV
jgi:hypothetical protein